MIPTTTKGNTVIDVQTNAELLQDAADSADAKLRLYSGRGMFGSSCLGIEVDNFGQAALFFAVLGDMSIDLAETLARRLRTDNMGYGMIVYFPGAVSDEVLTALSCGDDEEEEW
jgi:hypothetical protein